MLRSDSARHRASPDPLQRRAGAWRGQPRDARAGPDWHGSARLSARLRARAVEGPRRTPRLGRFLAVVGGAECQWLSRTPAAHPTRELAAEVPRQGLGPNQSRVSPGGDDCVELPAAFPLKTLEVIVKQALLGLFFAGAAVLPVAAQSVPQLPFESVTEPLKLPDDIQYFGEIAGVAVNSKGHVFVFSRRQFDRAVLHGDRRATARVRRQGQVHPRDRQEPLRLVLCARRAHRQGRQHLGRGQGLGHDPEDEPAGRVDWVFGRKGEASHLDGAARLCRHADSAC